jgi:hypothetical protein
VTLSAKIDGSKAAAELLPMHGTIIVVRHFLHVGRRTVAMLGAENFEYATLYGHPLRLHGNDRDPRPTVTVSQRPQQC